MIPPVPAHSFPNGCRALDLPAGFRLTRIHRAGTNPTWFGPAPGTPPFNRFDAPNGEYRTLYAAATVAGAFVETVLRRANRLISRTDVEQRAWSVLETNRPIKVAQLFGEGLIFHGVTSDICAGDDYRASQSLARDLFSTFDDLDGIAYRARHNNDEFCFALFDRLDLADLKAVELHRFSDQPEVANELLERHGAVWDISPAIPVLKDAG